MGSEYTKDEDDIHGTKKYEHTDFAYTFVQMHRDDTFDFDIEALTDWRQAFLGYLLC